MRCLKSTMFMDLSCPSLVLALLFGLIIQCFCSFKSYLCLDFVIRLTGSEDLLHFCPCYPMPFTLLFVTLHNLFSCITHVRDNSSSRRQQDLALQICSGTLQQSFSKYSKNQALFLSNTITMPFTSQYLYIYPSINPAL